MSGVIKANWFLQLQVNNKSTSTLRDISLASTTNAPAASRKRVNDESAPEELPTKRTKNPTHVVEWSKKAWRSKHSWKSVTWNLAGWIQYQFATLGSDKQSVNLSPWTDVVRRANIIMEFHPGMPPVAEIFDSQFCVDNFNGDDNAKPSDGKALRVSPSTMQCSEGIWSSRGEALGHLVTVGEMSVKGHQHKSNDAQVKQVNPSKFKLRLNNSKAIIGPRFRHLGGASVSKDVEPERFCVFRGTNGRVKFQLMSLVVVPRIVSSATVTSLALADVDTFEGAKLQVQVEFLGTKKTNLESRIYDGNPWYH
ncbi:hypothetical protein B0H13DRAFT_1892006 [Mycena leptocephala]|nr:hypothetical protein B0H13DRAFT_1892006 [Mycena leptocephala]